MTAVAVIAPAATGISGIFQIFQNLTGHRMPNRVKSTSYIQIGRLRGNGRGNAVPEGGPVERRDFLTAFTTHAVRLRGDGHRSRE